MGSRSTKAEDVVLGEPGRPPGPQAHIGGRSTKAEDVVLGEPSADTSQIFGSSCAQRRPRTSSSANAAWRCQSGRIGMTLNEGRGRRPRRTVPEVGALEVGALERSTKAEDVVLGEHLQRSRDPQDRRDRSTKAEDVVLGERRCTTTVGTASPSAQRRPRTSSSANGQPLSTAVGLIVAAQRRPRTSSSANMNDGLRRVSVPDCAQRRPRTSSSANPVRRRRQAARSALNEGRGRRPRRTRRRT